MMDIDAILELIGPFGKFQIQTVCVIGWFTFGVAIFVLIPTFLDGEPAWRCTAGSLACNLTGKYVAGDDEYELRCDMDKNDWEFIDSYTSIVTEWELYCDRSIYATITSSMFFAGFLLGAISIGYLSDRFGRRKPMCIAMLITCVVSLASSFSPNVEFFAFCRFCFGFFGGGSSLSMFLICMEVSGVEYRGTAGVGSWVFWVMSTLSLAPLAYFIREWEKLSLGISIIAMTCLPLAWFVPETPRWLECNGKYDDAEKLLRKIAKRNGKTYPELETAIDPNVGIRNQRQENFFDLFKTKSSAIRMCILWFGWAVNSMVYYCVSLGSSNIGGDMYVTYAIICAVELPATIFTVVITNKFGRKYPALAGMIIAAVASLITAALPFNTSQGYTMGRIIMSVVAKFAITVSFDTIYLWSGELIPTVVRNVGMGSCSTVGRLGSFAASYVNYLQRVHVMLPFGIMAFASLVATAFCWFLPETKGKPTPTSCAESGGMPDGNVTHVNKPENNNYSNGIHSNGITEEKSFDSKL